MYKHCLHSLHSQISHPFSLKWEAISFYVISKRENLCPFMGSLFGIRRNRRFCLRLITGAAAFARTKGLVMDMLNVSSEAESRIGFINIVIDVLSTTEWSLV